jgi:hypothetical protein
MKITTRTCVAAVIASISLAVAVPAAALGCGQIVGQPLLDTSDNCSSQPELDRYFGTVVMRWKGHNYLLVNSGNELTLYNIDQPLLPVEVDESRFNVPNLGDSDYDLMNFSVCNDCRYGIAAFKGGLVLFDFGDDEEPFFRADVLYTDAHSVEGAMTFKRGEQQYAVAAGFQEECDLGSSSLYTFNGLDAEEWVQLGCLASDEIVPFVVNGYYLPGAAGVAHLYLADRNRRVHAYELTGFGADLSWEYKGSPLSAYMIKSRGLSVDRASGLAVTANSSGLKLYDISDPAAPRLLTTRPGELGSAALRPPFIYTANRGWEDSSRSHYLASTHNLVRFDTELWDPLQWWNDYACQRAYDATFSPDGRALYVARYSVLQVISMVDCFDLIGPQHLPDYPQILED